MDRESLINELRKILGDYLEEAGFQLVDLIYRYEGGDLFLRILADRPSGGITIDECSRLNREISAILDEKGLPEQRYILEVSSPGLDRPLKTKSDFMRCINKRARFFLAEEIHGKIEWLGVVDRVDDEKVWVLLDSGTIEIPLDKINKAKQILD